MHTNEDTLARYRQSVELDSVLRERGVAHDFFTFKGWHGVPKESIDEAACRMFTWIAKYTK